MSMYLIKRIDDAEKLREKAKALRECLEYSTRFGHTVKGGVILNLIYMPKKQVLYRAGRIGLR